MQRTSRTYSECVQASGITDPMARPRKSLASGNLSDPTAIGKKMAPWLAKPLITASNFLGVWEICARHLVIPALADQQRPGPSTWSMDGLKNSVTTPRLMVNPRRAAMEALAGDDIRAVELKAESVAVEGNLRATGESKIENDSQVEAEQFVKNCSAGKRRGGDSRSCIMQLAVSTCVKNINRAPVVI